MIDISLTIWKLLAIVAVISLAVTFRKRNAVWGGLTIGIIVGIIAAIFRDNGLEWHFIAKCMIVGVLVGSFFELPTLFSNVPLINLSGVSLMEFCFINLSSYDDKVELLSGNLNEKIKLFFIKKKIINLINKTQIAIKCLDLELIIAHIEIKGDNEWDLLLKYIVIKKVTEWISSINLISEKEKVNQVLTWYVNAVLENHNDSSELVNLKIERIRIMAQMDLLNASAVLQSKSR